MPNQAKSFVKHDIESQIVERSPAHGMGSRSTHHLLLCKHCRRHLYLLHGLVSVSPQAMVVMQDKHPFYPFPDLPSQWL
jgi:hypothetical protein